MAWGDTSDTGAWDLGGWSDPTTDAWGLGSSSGIDPSLIGADGNPIVPPIPPPGGDPNRTWGQQVGDWLGLSDSTQSQVAAAASKLKGTLGDLKQIQQLADPMAPKPGEVGGPKVAAGLPPSQTRVAQSLDEVLQQLYQRRQALSTLGLSQQGWQPRGPGGGLLGSA